jgi:hypothetical protein
MKKSFEVLWEGMYRFSMEDKSAAWLVCYLLAGKSRHSRFGGALMQIGPWLFLHQQYLRFCDAKRKRGHSQILVLHFGAVFGKMLVTWLPADHDDFSARGA